MIGGILKSFENPLPLTLGFEYLGARNFRFEYENEIEYENDFFSFSLQASHRRVSYASHLRSYSLPKTNMKSVVSEKVTDFKFRNRR